ncbi:MAG: DUF4280 domain-containing protein [Clostridia bacterium]|nr:DUF4280 domain-containing protein [Clostridia bacterium]
MAAQSVASTAICTCIYGTGPMPLNATSAPTVLIEGKPAATIMDFAPAANVPPFVICNSPSNPASVAAKAVGLSAPCTPALTAPWIPGQPKVLIKGKPALTNTCKLVCALGGPTPVVSITNPGTTHTQYS